MCGETACVDRIPVSIPYVADGSIVKQTPLPKPDVVSGEPLVKISLSLRIIPKLAEPLLQLLGKMSPSTSSAGAVEVSMMSKEVALTARRGEQSLDADNGPRLECKISPVVAFAHWFCGSNHASMS